jgi:hypothetical protein
MTPSRPYPGALLVLALVAVSCSSTPNRSTIRYRAENPLIGEASRKVTIALEQEGFALSPGGNTGGAIRTGWKALRENETGREEKEVRGAHEGMLEVRLSPRGSLYDVEATVATRTVSPGDTTMHAPPLDHPLVAKWQRILRSLLTPEGRSED